MSLLSSPSGRTSMRRALFAVAVLTACGCAVASTVTHGDIGPGAVSVLSMVVAATAGAVTVGRFAERGTEAQPTPTGSDDPAGLNSITDLTK